MRVINGKILFSSQDMTWMSIGSKLYRSKDQGLSWDFVASLPLKKIKKFLCHFRLTRRFFRLGYHHFLPLNKNLVFIVANKEIYILDILKSKINLIKKLDCSRPLAICKDNQYVYYGEYKPNIKREPVKIWKSQFDLNSWEVAYTFNSIRHVHGVYNDPFTNRIWITTGDKNSESGLSYTDDGFKTVNQFLWGKQAYRAVDLIFTEKYIYYGSDTPREQNYLYRIDRQTKKLQKLIPLNGSVFYGFLVKNLIGFSTVIEPSFKNRSRLTEVVASFDGEKWFKVVSLKKDWWPSLLFQYGQIQFPKNDGFLDELIINPIACKYDQKSLSFSFDELRRIEKLCVE